MEVEGNEKLMKDGSFEQRICRKERKISNSLDIEGHTGEKSFGLKKRESIFSLFMFLSES